MELNFSGGFPSANRPAPLYDEKGCRAARKKIFIGEGKGAGDWAAC
jgi:hypothetical protein